MLIFAQTFPDTDDHPTGCAVAGWLWSVKKKSLSQSKSRRDAVLNGQNSKQERLREAKQAGEHRPQGE